MNVVPHLQHLLMLVLGIVLPGEELEFGEREGGLGEATQTAIRRFLAENGLIPPEGLREHSPEWIQWLIRELEAAQGSGCLVDGQVLERQQPVSGVKVTAFERDLPSLERRSGSAGQSLGEAVTDDQGRFKITYAADGFADGEADRRAANSSNGRADLSFSVVDQIGREIPISAITAQGREFGPSDIIFNVPQLLEVTILVDTSDAEEPSEYEKLLASIAPVVKDVPPDELTEDDIDFLLHELDLADGDKPRLEWLRRSALLARQSEIPVEIFYGWGRKDLPLPFHELAATAAQDLASVVERLAATSDEQRREALQRACDEDIIPDYWRDRTDELGRRLRRSVPVQRHGTGRLIDAESGERLANLTVQISELHGEGMPTEPAPVVTDSQGLFPLIYAAGVSSDRIEHRLRLKILKNGSTEIFDTEIRVMGGEEPKFVEVRVPIPVVPEPERHTLRELDTSVGLELPSELFSFLSAAGVRTLGDIRRRGGLSRLEGLPVPEDHPKMRLLGAHADLSRVSGDTRLNAFLIDKGFDRVLAIADAPRADFVGAVHSEIGDFNASKLHVVARAQTHFLDGVVAGWAADRANGYTLDQEILADDDAPPQRCHCRDCETAISPLAYLVDLRKYTVQHVKDNNAPITPQTLVDTFHQPFAVLPASCDSVDTRVRQVRLCVEVLRVFLGPRPLTDATKEADLSAAEETYRLATYQSLLSNLGTSYAELRLAQNGDPAERQSLADRLQIALSHLSALYLDPAANPAVLTESRLEQIFGLVDTSRDPLAPGATPELQTWRLAQLRTLWRSQDFTEDLYDDGRSVVALKQIPAGVTFAPPALAAKIHYDTAGQQLAFEGQMAVAERETLLALSADDAFQRAIRRLYHASQRLAIIDPDLVGPDDLREPWPGHDAFDLWKKRREWVDHRLQAFSTIEMSVNVDGHPEQVPDLEGILATMYQPVAYGAVSMSPWATTTPVTGFEKLREQLQGQDVEAAKFRIEDELNLSVESFGELMRIRAKDAAWLGDHRSERVTAEEWQDLRSILAQAQKIRLALTWRAEERAAALVLNQETILNPETFWISLTQPSEGTWPPPESAATPLIDPDILKPNELPDPIAGERAIGIRKKRQARLADVRDELRTRRETQGFDKMLRWALGHPNPGNPLQHDLDSLRNGLNSPDPDVVDDALQKITDELHLSADAFRRLLTIRAKDADPDPAKKPTAAEWDEVYTLLTPARKIKHEFPAWIQEEQNAATGVVYWSALKARLPPWRSSLESRGTWQTALRARSRTPVVDPDLIEPGDLRNPVAGGVRRRPVHGRSREWTCGGRRRERR